LSSRPRRFETGTGILIVQQTSLPSAQAHPASGNIPAALVSSREANHFYG
jgi:hypothetical protein